MSLRLAQVSYYPQDFIKMKNCPAYFSIFQTRFWISRRYVFLLPAKKGSLLELLAGNRPFSRSSCQPLSPLLQPAFFAWPSLCAQALLRMRTNLIRGQIAGYRVNLVWRTRFDFQFFPATQAAFKSCRRSSHHKKSGAEGKFKWPVK